ncbi:MAG: GNAT family N-acetyltransferase [Anaerolineales bacterium]|nr:GNAT family N-acetyltransferase [Anaerolineales bacterium]MCA9932221.1 GNAT family N-acetyltransferase [Anaerolineales bacterium]
MSIEVKPITPGDHVWVMQFLEETAHSLRVVSRGVLHQPEMLPGFIGLHNGKPGALLTYHITHNELEVVTLHSAIEEQGLGSALLQAAREAAIKHHCRRLWLITTNDNTHAIRFYQKRGMVITAIHTNALTHSRTLKPEIPLLGNDGIPIRDEIEFEIQLEAQHV